jgi:hypothetical protein
MGRRPDARVHQRERRLPELAHGPRRPLGRQRETLEERVHTFGQALACQAAGLRVPAQGHSPYGRGERRRHDSDPPERIVRVQPQPVAKPHRRTDLAQTPACDRAFGRHQHQRQAQGLCGRCALGRCDLRDGGETQGAARRRVPEAPPAQGRVRARYPRRLHVHGPRAGGAARNHRGRGRTGTHVPQRNVCARGRVKALTKIFRDGAPQEHPGIHFGLPCATYRPPRTETCPGETVEGQPSSCCGSPTS